MFPAGTNHSIDRCEWNTFTLLITSGHSTRVENLLGSVRAVEMDGITKTDGRDNISTVGAEAETDTKETRTGIIGGQAETMDIREGMGVVTEAMGLQKTSHTSNTDSCAENS